MKIGVEHHNVAGMKLRWAQRLTPHDVGSLRHLVATAAETDGVGPLSDDAALRLTIEPLTAGQHLTVTTSDSVVTDHGPADGTIWDDSAGTVAGYAYLATPDDHNWQAELVVHPSQRRRGIGGRLLAALTAAADQAGADLRVWAHGDPPAAAVLADGYGFGRERVLWQMRRPLSSTAPFGGRETHSVHDVPLLPDITVPPGVTVRTFTPGQDEDAWVAINSSAFADHPEQGRWTVEDLRLREAESWFDPAGFFLAESAGRLVGFHWTKVAEATRTSAGGESPSTAYNSSTDDAESAAGDLGEVYVVGVEPTFAGRGLGRTLTLIGLHHLRDRGLATAMLYVDDTNRPAVRLYEGLGFSRYSCDISYLRKPGVQIGSRPDRS